MVRFFRSLFSSDRTFDDWGDSLTGGLGVREPRRPIHPTLAGAAAVDLPPAESIDVWAVGEDR